MLASAIPHKADFHKRIFSAKGITCLCTSKNICYIDYVIKYYFIAQIKSETSAQLASNLSKSVALPGLEFHQLVLCTFTLTPQLLSSHKPLSVIKSFNKASCFSSGKPSNKLSFSLIKSSHNFVL